MTIGIFGNKARNTEAEKRHYSKPKSTRGKPPDDILLTLADARYAMCISWLSMAEMSQAVPPAYAEHLGKQFLSVVKESLGTRSRTHAVYSLETA